MNDSTPEWRWFVCNHSLFLARILLVVTSDPHMFFSNTLTHPIFVPLGLSLYKHIFLLHFNPNYDRLMFPMYWVIHNFIAVFQKIETTPDFGPTNLICTFLICFVQNVNKWAGNAGPWDQSLLGYHSISPSFPSHRHYPQIFHPVVRLVKAMGSRLCSSPHPTPRYLVKEITLEIFPCSVTPILLLLEMKCLYDFLFAEPRRLLFTTSGFPSQRQIDGVMGPPHFPPKINNLKVFNYKRHPGFSRFCCKDRHICPFLVFRDFFGSPCGQR